MYFASIEETDFDNRGEGCAAVSQGRHRDRPPKIGEVRVVEDDAAGNSSQLRRATIEEIQAKARLILDEVAGLVHANDQLLKPDLPPAKKGKRRWLLRRSDD